MQQAIPATERFDTASTEYKVYKGYVCVRQAIAGSARFCLGNRNRGPVLLPSWCPIF
ncbi:hypothetical protein CES86_1177 [Brucella lupini]|uniref:Uncharacterized protein n=1 Tax=Brucella lupini TaxID=255457 RepID=A0A256GWF4_9HYPH|nr:hypothetical protein CES86_1177 [Brucella lupini]